MLPTSFDQPAVEFSLHYNQPHQGGGEHKLQFHDKEPSPLHAKTQNLLPLLEGEITQAAALTSGDHVFQLLQAYEDMLEEPYQSSKQFHKYVAAFVGWNHRANRPQQPSLV